MTKTQRDAISTPATALMIYQTNSTPGFYYYNGSIWTPVAGANTSLSNLSNTAINKSLVPALTNSINIGSSTRLWKNAYFAGDALINGLTVGLSGGTITSNTVVGSGALISNTTGSGNTVVGLQSMNLNSTGYNNTAFGAEAMFNNVEGIYNTADGFGALNHNTNGISNIAMGAQTMWGNTTGSTNTALGSSALFNNTTGYNNVAAGVSALHSTTTDIEEVAIGDSAMYNLNAEEIPGENTAIGSKALYNETGSAGFGYDNTAVGYQSLYSQNNGYYNTALGSQAATAVTSGNGNTAVGAATMSSDTRGSGNTAVGSGAEFLNSTGNDNTNIGFASDANAINYSNSTALGSGSLITAGNQVRIGNGSVTSIGGFDNWTNISDGRVKKNINQNVPGLSFITKLQPVTYNLDLDAADKISQRTSIKDKNGRKIQPTTDELAARSAKEQIVYTGFIAQDVEKAAKAIGYDFSGVDAAKNDKDLYGLRYAEFVVPLVKAVQELNMQNDSLKSEIGELRSEIDAMKAVIVLNQSTIGNQQQAVISSTLLEQNIPNPFNNTTTIGYTLPQKFSSAQIIISNKNGNTIKSVNVSQAGKGNVMVDASAFASGAYQYSLIVDGKLIDTKQMVLTK
jgi:hypothetical protein